MPNETARAHERERIFGALVGVVAERSYPGAELTEIASLAGVSLSDLHEHFEDKNALMVAATCSLATHGLSVVSKKTQGRESWDGRLWGMLDALARLAATQPLAARVWLLEMDAAGTEPASKRDDAHRHLVETMANDLEHSERHRGSPRQLVDAIAGGIHAVFRRRLREGRQEELPDLAAELWNWGSHYPKPPTPLYRPVIAEIAPTRQSFPGLRGSGEVGRILSATISELADGGYRGMTVERIALRASLATETFYDHFDGAEDAFLAVLDEFQAQASRQVLHAFRRASDWPSAMLAGIRASHAFVAANSEAARTALLLAPTAGEAVIAKLDEGVRVVESMIEPGFKLAPNLPPVSAEAIAASLVSLSAQQLREGGSEAVLLSAPIATYLALTPFVGPEFACAVANSG